MLGIALDQGLYEGGFPDTRRADDGDNEWRGVLREAVDEGNMKSFFADVVRAGGLFLKAARGGEGEGFGVCPCELLTFCTCF